MDDNYESYDDAEPWAWTRLSRDLTQYPVQAAIRDGDLAKLQTLLAGAGHNINHNPSVTDAPLMAAVILNNREAARMLLEAGADPLLTDEDGVACYTPLGVAFSRGHDEIARLLWTMISPEKLAECERRDVGHRSCLEKVAIYGRMSLLEFLLDGWLGSGVWEVETLEAALLGAVCVWRLHAASLLLDRVIYAPETLQRALFVAVDIKAELAEDIYSGVCKAVDFTNQELLVKRLLDAGPLNPNLCEQRRPLIHYAIESEKLIGALRALLAKGKSQT